MNAASQSPDLPSMLLSLRSDRESISWTDRRGLAASLANALSDDDRRPAAVELATILAVDPKWEVRREVASLLTELSDDEFIPVAAVLSGDPNGYVRKAAERAIDLRRVGASHSGTRRKGLDQVLSHFELLEATQGRGLSEKARVLAMQLYEVSVAATVHDLRGILTSAQAKINRICREAAEASPDLAIVRESAKTVAARLEYLEKFVDDMGSFSQALTPERSDMPLTQIVSAADEVIRDCFLGAEAGVALSVTVDDAIMVSAAPYLLVTAFTNVLKNAYEAVLCTDDGRPEAVDLKAERIENENVRISIQDNGVGVSGEDLRELRAFMPGRTTKKGHGTGFGLPIAQRNIAAHGGTISIDSVENVGTTVLIRLPSAPNGMVE